MSNIVWMPKACVIDFNWSDISEVKYGQLQVQFSLAGSAWELKSWEFLINWIQNNNIPRGFSGNLIFAINAQMLCGNHLNLFAIGVSSQLALMKVVR